METRREFIDRVVEEITEGLTIPVSPKTTRISSIIDRALRQFRENDERGTEMEYIIIKSSAFQTDLFKSKRQVKFPEGCVQAVTFLRTMGSNFSDNNINPDFLKTNFNYVNALNGNPSDMTTSVVNGFYNNFLKNFILKSVAYEFSEYTSSLTVIGRDPNVDLIAEAYVYIPESSFYRMVEFFDYVCGQCKMSFANTMGFINSKQIGNYEVNLQEIRTQGKEMVEEVKEKWKQQRESADFFIDDNT